jgi:hypothetical protein
MAASIYGEAPKTGAWEKAETSCRLAAEALTADNQPAAAERYQAMATRAGEKAEAARAKETTPCLI